MPRSFILAAVFLLPKPGVALAPVSLSSWNRANHRLSAEVDCQEDFCGVEPPPRRRKRDIINKIFGSTSSKEVEQSKRIAALEREIEVLRMQLQLQSSEKGTQPIGRDAEVPMVLRDDEVCLMPGELMVRIEDAPSNSRRIFCAMDIFASVDEVWNVLTDYEHLADVVPSLVTNEVVETRPDGCRLKQVRSFSRGRLWLRLLIPEPSHRWERLSWSRVSSSRPGALWMSPSIPRESHQICSRVPQEIKASKTPTTW